DRIDAADDGGTPSAPIVSRASRSVADAVPVSTTFAIHVPRPQPAPAAREAMLFATMGRAASATSAQPSVRKIELIRPERIVLLTIFTPVGAYVALLPMPMRMAIPLSPANTLFSIATSCSGFVARPGPGFT